jgi:hypothetical protein
MQLINIYPLGNLCMEYSQSMHMFLTHLVEKYPMYRNVAQSVKGYKILDNSLIELGDAVDVSRVCDAAERIEAHEIILPDAFQDRDKTLARVDKALNDIIKRYGYKRPFKLMAVAQGKDMAEWVDCYENLLAIEEVDVIGVPKVLAKTAPGGRPQIVNEVCQLKDKPHHLLGLWYSVSEIVEYEHPEDIRSLDTVLMSYLTKNHIRHTMGVRPDGFTVDLERDVINQEDLRQHTLICREYFREAGIMI